MHIRSTEALGVFIRDARKGIGATQKDLALTSGTGLRFIIDLEKGKPTCQIGKILSILQNLGVKVELHAPTSIQSEKAK